MRKFTLSQFFPIFELFEIYIKPHRANFKNL